MRKLKELVMKLLRQGLSPERIALAAAVGLCFGVFPIYGPVTLLSLGIAGLLHLNAPLVVAGVYSMSFVKPLLIIPFLKLGEWIFRADGLTISLTELSRRFAEDAPGTLQEFGWSFIHATVGWLVVLPLLLFIIYRVVLMLVRGWQRAKQAVTENKAAAIILLCIGGVTALPGIARAADEPLFEPSLSHAGTTLELHGTGVLKYKWIIPVYDTALYLPANADSSAALNDIPKAIAVRYRVSAEADRFHAAGRRNLTSSFSPETYQSIADRFQAINRLFPDPEKGDRCELIYIPGRGTELIYNGTSRGIIEGADFARIYFSIWLGENPASPALRDDLLNR